MLYKLKQVAPRSNLDKLAKLTESLTKPLSELTRIVDGNVAEYSSVPGDVVGQGLYNDRAVAVQKVLMKEGAVVDRHTHKSFEIMVIYEGKIRFYDDRGTHDLDIGDSIYYPPGVAHSAEAMRDSWMIAITVPSAEGYPSA
jgi:quercetin dioxygenase-like cupin family protein